MDIWAIVQGRLWKLPLPNWALPGRWLTHVFRGQIAHNDIHQSDEVPYELILGWFFHYAVGVAYGILFLLIVGTGWLEQPKFLSAWLFAIATIAAGWFVLQPGMGLGWAASKTPNPWKTRSLGLVAHTAFGAGLWLTGTLVG